MSKPDNIFLVGPMGVGKSTIGRMLGTTLQRPFYDSDREIEAVTGADIPWIFDVEGEAGFRQREIRMIDQLWQPVVEPYWPPKAGNACMSVVSWYI